jgi:hypothetical protein
VASISERIQDLERRRTEATRMGGEEAVARQHEK